MKTIPPFFVDIKTPEDVKKLSCAPLQPPPGFSIVDHYYTNYFSEFSWLHAVRKLFYTDDADVNVTRIPNVLKEIILDYFEEERLGLVSPIHRSMRRRESMHMVRLNHSGSGLGGIPHGISKWSWNGNEQRKEILILGERCGPSEFALLKNGQWTIEVCMLDWFDKQSGKYISLRVDYGYSKTMVKFTWRSSVVDPATST